MAGQKVITKREQFSTNLEKMLPTIRAILPKHLTPERMSKIALQAVINQPTLLECSMNSVLRSILQAAEMGLEIGGALGHAYLVPFKAKDGNKHAQLIPGYRGLVDLVRRTGLVMAMEARLVRESDHFNIRYGLEPILDHQPNLETEDKVIAAYAIATFKDGSKQFEVMSRKQLDGIRAKSKAGQSGPWATDTDEMQRKTVIRRLIKLLPTSPELRHAVELGDAVDISGGDAMTSGMDFDIPEEQEPVEKSTAQGIKEDVAQQKQEERDFEQQREARESTFYDKGQRAEIPLDESQANSELITFRNMVMKMLDKRFPKRIEGKNPSSLKTEWLKKNADVTFLADIENMDKLKELADKLAMEIEENQ